MQRAGAVPMRVGRCPPSGVPAKMGGGPRGRPCPSVEKESESPCRPNPTVRHLPCAAPAAGHLLQNGVDRALRDLLLAKLDGGHTLGDYHLSIDGDFNYLNAAAAIAIAHAADQPDG